jgi:PAS domain S-box-containing protein
MAVSGAELSAGIFQQALDGMCVGMVVVDGSGRVVWANRAARCTLGIDGEAARGRALSQLLVDPHVAAFWREASKADETIVSEAALTSPHPAHLRLNAARCIDGAGRTIGRALLFCDVTADRAIQIRLSEEATSRLMQLAEAGRSPAQSCAGLTAKELEVLRLIGRGASNVEVSRQLGVAASTVKSHVKRIYRKLGLNSRTAAVRCALENGLA